MPAVEKQVTFAPHGHGLVNAAVWSPDGLWIAYDVRDDPASPVFDGTRIERVEVATGRVEVLYESRHGAGCGVATCSPTDDRVIFIHGPEHPTPDWQYAFYHRRGVIVDARRPGVAVTLDACDVAPPFTPGALRGGSHVHTFSGDGQWVSFTYEDHVLAQLDPAGDGHDLNQRNIGVSAPLGTVAAPKTHPRNHDGSHFSVLVTRTVNRPRPGSDEISKAFEDAWVGTNGYDRSDGRRQRRTIAFQGQVVTEQGETISEAFLVDIPDDVTVPGDDGPLEGTATRRPQPPRGIAQRRLTFTAGRKFPGLQGPRHWLRSTPDGDSIAFLMRDDNGVVQLWTISPNGGDLAQLTRNRWDVASTFTWSPDGQRIAHVMDNSVCLTDAKTGETTRLTQRAGDESALRPDACVFAPDGSQVAYVRSAAIGNARFNQVFVVAAEGAVAL